MPEGEENEKDAKKIAQMRIIEQKARALQQEFIELAVEEDEMAKIEEHLKEVFSEKKMPFSLIHINAFSEGMEFGISGSQNNLQMAMTVQLVLRRLVETRKKELAKMKNEVA